MNKSNGTCSFEDCDGTPIARGWCQKHYARWWKHGDASWAPPTTPERCTVDGCDRKHASRGYCSKHYERWLKHGDLRRGRDETVRERFMSKVEPEPNTGCWLWTGTVVNSGYGTFCRGAQRDVTSRTTAHRFAYEEFNGPIPDGLFVLHHCDVKLCVNPAHLFVGTHSDNMRDMVAKGRASTRPRQGTHNGRAPTRSRQGAHNGRAKLTDDQVRAIRASVAAGESQKALAREYRVSRACVGHIVHGRQWRHVP